MLLSPLTLRNHGEWLPLDELSKREPHYQMALDNARFDVEWDLKRIAREFYNDTRRNRFIHLADGGLVDNQGLQAILDEFELNGMLNLLVNQTKPPLERLVILNVNAGTRADDSSASRERAPKALDVVRYTMVTSMDILSAKRWLRLQDHCGDLEREGNKARRAGLGSPRAQLHTYAVEINFRQLEDGALRKRCNRIPTSFALTPDKLESIERAAVELVASNEELDRLADDLSAAGLGGD